MSVSADTLNTMLEWHTGFGFYIAVGDYPKTRPCLALDKFQYTMLSSAENVLQFLQACGVPNLSCLPHPVWFDMSHVASKDYFPILATLNARRGSAQEGTGYPLLLQIPKDALPMIQYDCLPLWRMRTSVVIDFNTFV